jgi:hypothetical protein
MGLPRAAARKTPWGKEADVQIGMVSRLSHALGVSRAQMAWILGFSESDLDAWDRGGVPIRHHFAFDLVFHCLRKIDSDGVSVHDAIRLPLPGFAERSLLDLLTEVGPGAKWMPAAVEELGRILARHRVVPVDSATFTASPAPEPAANRHSVPERVAAPVGESAHTARLR